MLVNLSLLYLFINSGQCMVHDVVMMHSLARAGGTEDHLVAVLGLLPHQPREAGLCDLLPPNLTAASESPIVATLA